MKNIEIKYYPENSGFTYSEFLIAEFDLRLLNEIESLIERIEKLNKLDLPYVNDFYTELKAERNLMLDISDKNKKYQEIENPLENKFDNVSLAFDDIKRRRVEHTIARSQTVFINNFKNLLYYVSEYDYISEYRKKKIADYISYSTYRISENSITKIPKPKSEQLNIERKKNLKKYLDDNAIFDKPIKEKYFLLYDWLKTFFEGIIFPFFKGILMVIKIIIIIVIGVPLIFGLVYLIPIFCLIINCSGDPLYLLVDLLNKIINGFVKKILNFLKIPYTIISDFLLKIQFKAYFYNEYQYGYYKRKYNLYQKIKEKYIKLDSEQEYYYFINDSINNIKITASPSSKTASIIYQTPPSIKPAQNKKTQNNIQKIEIVKTPPAAVIEPVVKNKEKNALKKIVKLDNFVNPLYDCVLSDEAKKDIGEKGELLAIEYEKQKLISANKNYLLAKIQHISKINNSAGYDILSFDTDTERQIKIEVKTTAGGFYTNFYITDNELNELQNNADTYYLYRIYEYNELDNSGKIFIMNGKDDLFNYFNIQPLQYKVKLKRELI